MKMQSTRIPAGPLKRVWVNKHCLPQYGGQDPHSPAWEIEVAAPVGWLAEPSRYRGYRVALLGEVRCVYDPARPAEGPHAWVETGDEVVVYSAVEEEDTQP